MLYYFLMYVQQSDSVLHCIYTYLCTYIWGRQWQSTPVLLPGKSHGWKSLVGCSPWGCKESDTTERLHFHFSLSCIGEGNVNPVQCSCLENPRDGGAWWAAIYGVAQSWTQLKRLSSNSRYTEGFPGGASGKELACQGRRCKEMQVPSLGWEDFPGGEHGNPFQHLCLENPLNGGGWWVTVQSVEKSQAGLK